MVNKCIDNRTLLRWVGSRESEEWRVYGSPGYGNYPTGPRARGRETLSQAALLLITGRDNMGTWRLTTTPARRFAAPENSCLLLKSTVTFTTAVKDTAHSWLVLLRLSYNSYWLFNKLTFWFAVLSTACRLSECFKFFHKCCVHTLFIN